MDKVLALKELASKRKADRLPGHSWFGNFHQGIYDKHDFVVPWSIGAHNYDADVMIMGQDWNSADRLAWGSEAERTEQAALGQISGLPSNQNLQKLLLKYLDLKFRDTFATDLFAFVKPGGMSGYIPPKDLEYSCKRYALPQIEIVSPLVVICLGRETYNTLRRCVGLRGSVNIENAFSERITYGKSQIVGVTHTGGRAFNAAQSKGTIDKQWTYLASRLKELREQR